MTPLAPAPLPLKDELDAAGWTGEIRSEDYFGRGRRLFVLPGIVLIILTGLAAGSHVFQLVVLLPILMALLYFIIAYEANHLHIRITLAQVTISSAPLWLPDARTIATAQLHGFEVMETKVWLSNRSHERVEHSLWEIFAVVGSGPSDRLPLRLKLAFRQPRPAESIAARLNWALDRVRTPSSPRP